MLVCHTFYLVPDKSPHPAREIPTRSISMSHAISRGYPYILLLFTANREYMQLRNLGTEAGFHFSPPRPSRPHPVSSMTLVSRRTQAYDLPVEVGLMSFGSDVKLDCEITPLLENFRVEVIYYILTAQLFIYCSSSCYFFKSVRVLVFPREMKQLESRQL